MDLCADDFYIGMEWELQAAQKSKKSIIDFYNEPLNNFVKSHSESFVWTDIVVPGMNEAPLSYEHLYIGADLKNLEVRTVPTKLATFRDACRDAQHRLTSIIPAMTHQIHDDLAFFFPSDITEQHINWEGFPVRTSHRVQQQLSKHLNISLTSNWITAANNNVKFIIDGRPNVRAHLNEFRVHHCLPYWFSNYRGYLEYLATLDDDNQLGFCISGLDSIDGAHESLWGRMRTPQLMCYTVGLDTVIWVKNLY